MSDGRGASCTRRPMWTEIRQTGGTTRHKRRRELEVFGQDQCGGQRVLKRAGGVCEGTPRPATEVRGSVLGMTWRRWAEAHQAVYGSVA